MLANGAPNFPDPSSNGASGHLSGINPAPPFSERPRKPVRSCRRAALTFAQCMRAHGVSRFPDPLTTYGPGFTLAQGEYFHEISTTEMQSPAFTQAAKACGLPPPP